MGNEYWYQNFYFDSALITTWIIVCSTLLLLSIAGLWAIFRKAGEPGWAAIIPFYNVYILYKITWGNGWLFLLLLIPFVDIVIVVITTYKLSRAFGHGLGYCLGLLLFPFLFQLIVGFGSSQYLGVSE